MNFNLLQITILIFLLITNFLVSNSKNAVHSVLFLILSFVLSSVLLFLFKADFLALLSIIIYVGAIAVLFLFVVMMLNVKSTTINSNFFFLAIITLMLLLLNIFLLIDKVFTDNFFVNTNTTTVIDVLTNIEIFGQLLYNYNIYLVLIAGFLLLIALVGSISISIKRNF